MASGVDVPIYAFCLIIIAMVGMFVGIIILIILLKKSKKNDSEYKVFPMSKTSTSLGLDKLEYQRQDSTSPNILSECETVKVEDPYMKHSCSVRNISNLETSLSSYEVNLPPRVKKQVPANVILPEQMMAICRDVLNKRPTDNNTNDKDVTEILHQFRKHDKPAINDDKTNNMREMSMSTPDLDIYDNPLARNSEEGNITTDLDIYDSIPARRPRDEIYNEVGEQSKIEADDNDIHLYDSLPSPYIYPKQCVVIDQDTHYLLPMSGAGVEEPSYVNANRNNYIL